MVAGVCTDCCARVFLAAAGSWELDHASRLMRLCVGKAMRRFVVWLCVRLCEDSSSVLGRGGVDGWEAGETAIRAGGKLVY